MPIRYPVVGALVWDQVSAANQAGLIDGLAAILVAAGWTDDARAASVVLTFTGLPANAQTCTFDGIVYTFKTVINNANAREILIGGTAADCAQNLLDCLNDTGSGEGTTYSSATTVHPTCTASIVGAAVTVTYNTAGGAGDTIVAAVGLSNATLNSTAFTGGGSWLTCAKTPQGLQCKVIIREGSAGYVNIYFCSVDELAISSGGCKLVVAAGRMIDVVACAHQFFAFLLGTSTTAFTVVMGGVPYIRDTHASSVIASVSDSGGTFLVTTTVPHGQVTGDHVVIAEATRDSGIPLTALNGTHQVTVIDSTSYTLDASVYEAGYDASSAVSAGNGQLSRAIWAKWDRGGQFATFRNSIAPGGGYSYPGDFCVTNLVSYTYEPYSVWAPARLLIPVMPGGNEIVVNYGGSCDLLEARIAWPPAAGDGTKVVIGELWCAFVVNVAVPIDTIKDSFDGHNWINITNNNAYGSLWLATA